MEVKELLKDAALSAAGGFVGTKVMEPVAMKLYQIESEEARQQENNVRPGPPFKVAAKKTMDLLGVELSEKQMQALSKIGFHYGLGASWVPVYLLLRRKVSMKPVSAGLAAGAAMSLIVDEGLTPALGFSAPNREYPPVTHLRGFAAHLAYGLGVALTVEGLSRVLRR